MTNPVEDTATKTRRLNTTTLDVTKCLQQLRADNIGGLLVVTQVVDGTRKGNPFLTILLEPSVTTFNATTGDVGVILADLWEDRVLNSLKPDLDPTVVHCPVIGVQEGFSRSHSFKASVVSILQDAQPYFLPEGELTCAMVPKDSVEYPRTAKKSSVQ